MHTSASEIWKNIALLHPISNEAEGYGMQTHHFFLYYMSVCVKKNLSSSLTFNAQSLKFQNFFLDEQHACA